MSDGYQFEIDFRTGLPTGINDASVTPRVRASCHALNVRRKSGLEAAIGNTPSRREISIDVWDQRFVAQLVESEIPVLDLERLGIYHDEGFLASKELMPLPSGAEASPFLDTENQVVYKLFDLRPNGSMGKRLEFGSRAKGFEVETVDGTWADMIDKFTVLNCAGGHPTELVGVSEDAHYVIAKQPAAGSLLEFRSDLRQAEKSMYGVRPLGGDLREHLVVIFVESDAWIVGDLHKRNVMRDTDNCPTIIDALLGRATTLALSELSWLSEASRRAAIYRETGKEPENFFSQVDDSEL